MRDDEVPNKTDAGRDEIQSRALKLPNVLRSILLMVDGQRSVGQLRGVIGGLKGPEDALDQLEAMGLIAVPKSLAAAAAATIPDAARATTPPTAAAPVANANGYSALYTLMSETVPTMRSAAPLPATCVTLPCTRTQVAPPSPRTKRNARPMASRRPAR